MEQPTSKKLKFSELPEEKQKEINKLYGDLQLLVDFGNKANEKLFIFLFEEQLGKHLWYQFKKMNNLFTFINYLDVGNRSIILSNVYGHDRKFSPHPLYDNCY